MKFTKRFGLCKTLSKGAKTGETRMSEHLGNQVVGNVGLFYVCYRLSRLGWNCMPTARNARGVDVLIYSNESQRKWSIQVKALSKIAPVPLGGNLDNLFADFVIVCNKAASEKPECFVLRPDEVRDLCHRGEKDGRISYWLQPKSYAVDAFREKWDRIGSGSGDVAVSTNPSVIA